MNLTLTLSAVSIISTDDKLSVQATSVIDDRRYENVRNNILILIFNIRDYKKEKIQLNTFININPFDTIMSLSCPTDLRIY